jgi:PRTRC genetic system protein A
MTKPVGHLINNLNRLDGESGVFYSYIMAAGGLYLRAKNEHLSVTVNIADGEVRGLAPICEDIDLIHGKIPQYLLDLAISKFMLKPDIEQYMAITWEGLAYWLREPSQEAGPGHVNYETVPGTVMDLHSHTGSMPARFSGIDDFDDKGFSLYGVVADLRQLFPTVELRLGIYGYMLPIKKEEVIG